MERFAHSHAASASAPTATRGRELLFPSGSPTAETQDTMGDYSGLPTIREHVGDSDTPGRPSPCAGVMRLGKPCCMPRQRFFAPSEKHRAQARGVGADFCNLVLDLGGLIRT